jgi:hypothetical protein
MNPLSPDVDAHLGIHLLSAIWRCAPGFSRHMRILGIRTPWSMVLSLCFLELMIESSGNHKSPAFRPFRLIRATGYHQIGFLNDECPWHFLSSPPEMVALS